MKWTASLILALFVAFIATPTVIAMIEKSCDTSIFYTMTEEEENHKDFKVVFEKPHGHPEFEQPERSSGKILYENLSRHDNASATIFSPPPELA